MIRKNLLSVIVTLIIIYLSLSPAKDFDNVKINIPNFDKFIHFMMYLSLMSVIIFEHRRNIRNYKSILQLAIFPVCLGITLEILQILLHNGRTGSIYDEMANLTGLLGAFMLWYVDRKRKNPLVR
jgi:VanZ family protein